MDLIHFDDDDERSEMVCRNLDNLKDVFRQKNYQKRSLSHGVLTLSPEVHIAIRLYAPVHSATVPSASWLEVETNNPLTIESTWICKETGALLQEHQIKTYAVYGGERVFFTKLEMGALKQIGDGGFTLMGFKPLSQLLPSHNLKAPNFIYPDESAIKGSSTAFRALVEEMASQGKFAVARASLRKSSIPRFVGLVPQVRRSVVCLACVIPFLCQCVNFWFTHILSRFITFQLEKFGADGVLEQGPGMCVIYLPFADELRQVKLDSTPVGMSFDDDIVVPQISYMHLISWTVRLQRRWN
jgi:hypothetical protein